MSRIDQEVFFVLNFHNFYALLAEGILLDPAYPEDQREMESEICKVLYTDEGVTKCYDIPKEFIIKKTSDMFGVNAFIEKITLMQDKALAQLKRQLNDYYTN